VAPIMADHGTQSWPSDIITLHERGQKHFSNHAVATGGICLTHDTWRTAAARVQGTWRAQAVQFAKVTGWAAAHR